MCECKLVAKVSVTHNLDRQRKIVSGNLTLDLLIDFHYVCMKNENVLVYIYIPCINMYKFD